MSLQPYWQYYKDIFPFVISSGMVFIAFFGFTYGYFLYLTLSLGFGFYAFSSFKKNEYYLYYNLGITKWKLLKVSFVINFIGGIPIFIISYLLFALIFGEI